MRKYFVFALYCFCTITEVRSQHNFVVSRNFSDFLYKDIFNEVYVFANAESNKCDISLKSFDAVIEKKGCSTFFIKPTKKNETVICVFLQRNENMQDSILFILKDLPAPKLLGNFYNRFHYLRIPDRDSLIAIIDLENNRSINFVVRQFDVKMFRKSKLIKTFYVEGSYFSSAQISEMRTAMKSMSVGDRIELVNIKLYSGELERVIPVHKLYIR